jgi:hypothetical protein
MGTIVAIDPSPSESGPTMRTPQPARIKPPTSKNLDDFSTEIQHAGNRRTLLARVEELRAQLRNVLREEDFEIVEVTGRAAKRNLAQRFSEAIAQKIADELRRDFDGIWPDESGAGHESLSRGAGGLKKLDVNYSTQQGGLGLAVSVKTINFADEGSRRFTKNVKRVDGELRAEAQDCHEYHPYAVIAVYLFMPSEASLDGRKKSSVRHAGEVLAERAGRKRHDDPNHQVELAFIGLYQDDGVVRFFRPQDIPERGEPHESLTFSQTLEQVRLAYRDRRRK